MKAKAKIELDVVMEGVSSIDEAKAHLFSLLEKFKKVAQKSKVTSLELEVSEEDISDLVTEKED